MYITVRVDVLPEPNIAGPLTSTVLITKGDVQLTVEISLMRHHFPNYSGKNIPGSSNIPGTISQDLPVSQYHPAHE